MIKKSELNIGDRVICLDADNDWSICGDTGTIIEMPEMFDETVLVEWDKFTIMNRHDWWIGIDKIKLIGVK